jgi:hypothetical protein
VPRSSVNWGLGMDWSSCTAPADARYTPRRRR